MKLTFIRLLGYRNREQDGKGGETTRQELLCASIPLDNSERMTDSSSIFR